VPGKQHHTIAQNAARAKPPGETSQPFFGPTEILGYVARFEVLNELVLLAF
jgi:hypothetical protein